ncbi:hypothetical protein [Yinghuangia sp. YIM S10712]|uniref:hypothetical protein n=1 Tax=Yinghuangia sp. YIM S10712 TaxID=3436930 RepID=UPI003F535AA5
MQPRLEATLADFVPALRFLSPDRVDRHLGHENLPPAWWTSVPIARAVDVIGSTELPDRLADLAYTELRHLRLGDLLPAAWLARNDFRLSQWPDGVRTNVLVRTPDWADLLGATVQEIRDWTNIGTTTVRPVISQLFAEVLGLLPADQATGEAAAVAAQGTAESGEEESDAESGRSAEAPEAAVETDEAEEADEAASARAEAPAEHIVPAPRGIRISKRPPIGSADDSAGDSLGGEAASEHHEDHASEDTPEDAFDGFTPTASDAPTQDPSPEGFDDLVDAIEDELRPVSIPAPPTGDLSVVVRWLAEEAPDIPLISELTRITLETASVVGLESASPEVRTALLRLMPLVPGSLLPEGLDISDDFFADASADAEDPYDAPEMTSILSAAPPVPDLPEAPEFGDADEPETEAARADEARADSGAGADDMTVLAVPGTPPPPPAWAADADDLTVLAMPPVPSDDDAPDSSASAADSDADEASDADDSVDAFGEVPPMTRDDFPAQSASSAPAADPGQADGEESVDAFGEIPPSTRDDLPIQPTPGRLPADDATALRKSPLPGTHKSGDAPGVEPSAAPGAQGFVIPPKPTAPPPIPPRPAGTAPTADDTPPAHGRAESPAEPLAEVGDATSNAEDPETGPVPAPGNIVLVLAAWFTGREPRWRTLARDRLFTDSPRELTSLAGEFGKDSVEVEALERALRRHLADQLDQPGGAAIREHLNRVETDLGPVATVAELRDLDRRHTATIPGLGVQLWQVVRGLLSLNTSVDGWLTAGAPGELESRTAEIVRAACERSGSVPFAALEPPLSALGIRAEVREAWIARLDGFDLEDGVVRPWPADESGPVPAAPTVVADRPPALSPHQAAGEPAASAAEPGDAGDAGHPGDAARCFRDDQGVWWYRVDVEAPLLDGERLPLPPQFVHALGLRPGGSVRLHHAAGPAALRWEREPYCVSLRAILAGLGAEIGDMVFIGSVRPGRLETRLLAGDGKLRLPRWARALRHTGVDPVPDQVNLPALLGARLGLDDGCDLKAVLKRLQDRGDGDVLELLGVASTR